MSEIEKMYENAGVKLDCCKYAKYGCEGEEGTWYYCKKDCKECWTYPNGDADCVEKGYPPFTAEKQLELFKLLIKHPKTEVYCRYANSKYKLIMYTEDCCAHDMDSFESALASVVCDVWGLLSEEERKQISEILRG